jgi:hypothetical protein
MVSSKLLLKRSFFIFAGGLLLSSVQNRAEQPSTFQTACIAGGVIAGGIAVGKFLHWMFQRSDEDLLRDAMVLYEQTRADYRPMIAMVESGCCSSCTEVSESLLYNLATTYAHYTSMACHRSTLKERIKKLHSEYNELCARVAKQNGRTYKEGFHDGPIVRLYKMEQLANDIASVLPSLEYLYDFLDFHKTYFMLYEKEAELLSRYSRPLDTFSVYRFDRYNLEYYIRAEVVMYYVDQSHIRYPYMEYVKMLKRDISALDSTLQKVVGAYYGRIESGRILYANLNALLSIIMASQEYYQDLRNFEQDKLEQERLEIARRKAELQRMQTLFLLEQAEIAQQKEMRVQEQLAQTEARKAQAQERQARAQEKQAQELARQNALKEQELIMKELDALNAEHNSGAASASECGSGMSKEISDDMQADLLSYF